MYRWKHVIDVNFNHLIRLYYKNATHQLTNVTETHEKKFKEAHRNNVRNRMNSSEYVLENYIAVDSKFPPTLWAKPPDLLFPYTKNDTESYHSHLNAEFYVKHPNIYVFVDVLKKIQQTTYVSMNSMSHRSPNRVREKTAFVVSAPLLYDYRTQRITRKEFLKKVCYRYGPRTELWQCS